MAQIKKVVLETDKGKETTYDVLMTFEDKKKYYMVYTDNKKDPMGNKTCYVSSFDPTLKVKKIEPVTSEEILNKIKIALKEYKGE